MPAALGQGVYDYVACFPGIGFRRGTGSVGFACAVSGPGIHIGDVFLALWLLPTINTCREGLYSGDPAE